jgi:uncharacterized zinc-type alcohol dehydrogenase-like protein
MTERRAYGTTSSTTPLAPMTIPRRQPRPSDVELEILYCGVCHTDLHQLHNEWGASTYPMVPGHEIVGRVVRTGSAVTRIKEGDVAGVGCMVDSCRECDSCRRGLEQYCLEGNTLTYNSPDPHLAGRQTYGGYSDSIVVDEAFVLRLSANADLAATAPLLCAGITTWSPLRQFKIGPGHKVGVIGLGGLGHMGLKLARAFGAEVVLFTTSPRKAEDARRLGAHEVVVSSNAAELQRHAGSFDLILDPVAVEHDLNRYLALLKLDGTLVLLGAPATPLPLHAFQMIAPRRHLVGSMIGGIAETQEMLDFCAAENIVSEVEVIPIQQINAAFERLAKGDVKYRFVIDMKSLRA